MPQLPRWRESGELAQRLTFAVIPRPDEPPVPAPAGFQVRELHGFPLAVSASQIRERIQAGLPIDLLVPPGVAEVIVRNQLYR